jgi:hypothetical protein
MTIGQMPPAQNHCTVGIAGWWARVVIRPSAFINGAYVLGTRVEHLPMFAPDL